jgi:acetyl esterase/lipase
MRFCLLLPLVLAAQTNFPPSVKHVPDIEYSSVGGKMQLDIVQPATPSAEPGPAVLLVHGGGFRRGTRQTYLPLAGRLAEKGYVAAATSYRLAPRNQFPAAVEDVKAAVRFLRANAGKFNIDPNRIGALGGSAGGHLVLFLGLTGDHPAFEGSGPNREHSSRVQAVVNYYGPSDFTQSYDKSVDAAEVLPLFLGGDLRNNRLAHIKASPLNWVTPQAAPVLSIHGTEDTFVAYEHSVWITDRLIAAGVPAELETISGAGHGFRGADAERAEQRAIAFFDKHLARKPRQRILVSDHGPNGEILELDWPSGTVHWRHANSRGHDVQSLANGHVLFTIGARKTVSELDAAHKVVWSYSDGLEHPLAAQRLPNGNTLIADARLGKVIEVTPDKRIAWKYESPDLANMRSRNARRTPQDTTLIAVEMASTIIEVNRDGKIIWQWRAPGQDRRTYQALRLANGNTLISISDPGEVVEVDREGKVVRSIGGDKPDIKFGWASGMAVLDNGNLLINDYTGRRIVEVDAKGKLVHEFRTGAMTIASIDVVR